MLLIGYPKSGNTWISYVLAYCLNMPYDNLHEPGVHPREQWQRDLVKGGLPHRSFAEEHGAVLSTHDPADLAKRKESDFVVYLVRDGRDVMVSYYYYLNRFVPSDQASGPESTESAQETKGDEGGAFERFIGKTAEEWQDHVKGCLGEKPQFVLKYEDMNARPRETLKKLFAAMKCGVSEEVIDAALEAFSFDRLSGRKKGEENKNSFFRKGVSGDWRSKFTAEACGTFVRRAGDALLELGYEKDHAWAGALQETDSYMTSKKQVVRLEKELVEAARDFFGQKGFSPDSTNEPAVTALVQEFLSLFRNRPVRDNVGGSGFHNCFWLFLTTRLISPQLIVESGVWKGQTTWILRQAAPEAELHCFDISLKKLVWRDGKAGYHEHDWTRHDFGDVSALRTLCFFDDHINQARRVAESHERGFDTLVLDDGPPAHKLYPFGLPPVPTVAMLFDESLAYGDRIEWIWQGKEMKYEYREADVYGARELIRSYNEYPDVGALTRYGGFSHLGLALLAKR